MWGTEEKKWHKSANFRIVLNINEKQKLTYFLIFFFLSLKS